VKILILKFRNIGDVLLVSPLLSNLKLYYPNSTIDIAVNKGTESMVDVNPHINKVIVYDRTSIKSLTIFKRIWREFGFIWSFRKRQYDLVINLTKGDRGAQIAWLSNAKIRIGYPNKNKILKRAFTHHMPDQGARHTLETNIDPLYLLHIPVNNKKVRIYWNKSDEKVINDKLLNLNSFIHIHPVSRWMFKCIADQTMAQIIDYCELELKTKVVITAAPIDKEIDRVNSILRFCKSDPINLSGELSLRQTAALNKRSKIFIGVDTAIMHLSAANDVPVLAFFGPSGAHQWGPWDNSLMQSNYNNKNGMQSMGMHQVISESRDCQPCGKDGCNGTKVSDCLMSLKLELIKDKINLIFKMEEP